MEIRTVKRNSGVSVTEILATLQTERDVVDLIGLCGERNADRLLLLAHNLPEEFFDLKSGLAGMMLQKFANYHLAVALVVPSDRMTGRFKELANELSSSPHARIFTEQRDAEHWLLQE